MSTLIFTAALRSLYRDVLVSPDDLFCTTSKFWFFPPPAQQWKIPDGEFDAADYIKTVPEKWRSPSLVVTLFDPSFNIVPRNMKGVTCPKVMLVSDTHHGERWLGNALAYAHREQYDLVLVQYTRQHVHFFKEAGVKAGWLPHFLASPLETHPPLSWAERTRDLTFMGQVGQYHPYRLHVLTALTGMGLPLVAMEGTRKITAKTQAESRICLNVSLNGDLNLRVQEILGSGALLMTDRLCPESGTSLLFEDGRHLVQFDDEHDLARKVTYFLAHPSEAEAIAQAGHALYMERYRPQHKMELLKTMVSKGLSGIYDVADDPRLRLPRQDLAAMDERLFVYQFLVEMHRLNVRLDVLFWGDVERHATDAVDLNRMRISVFEQKHAAGEMGPMRAGGMADRVKWRGAQDVLAPYPRGRWHFVVIAATGLGDPEFLAMMRARFCDDVIVAGYQEAVHKPVVEGLKQEFGLRQARPVPLWLTTRPASKKE